MVPLLLAGIAVGTGLAAHLARRSTAFASLVAAGGLGAIVVVALMVPIGLELQVGQVAFGDPPLGRAWIAASSGMFAVGALIGALTVPDRGLPVAASVTVVALALSFAAAEPSIGLIVAAVAGLGIVAAAGAPAGGLRQGAIVPAAFLLSIPLADLPATGYGGNVAVALCGAALVLRLGIVPFHVVPLRMARIAGAATNVAAVAWLPYLVGLLAVTWADGAVAPLLARDDARAVFLVLGAATIILAALAMLVQHDLGAIVAVHAIGDAGLVLVALAAGPPALAALAVWLLISATSRAAVGAWAAALVGRTGARHLSGLGGWIWSAPLLLPVLVMAVVAGLGWPGSLAFESRFTITESALPGELGTYLAVASLATSLGYLRILFVGTGRRTAPDGARRGWTIRLADWAAASLALGVASLPLAIGLGLTALDAAAAIWPIARLP